MSLDKNLFINFFHYLADFFFPSKCLLCRNSILSYNDRYFCVSCVDSFHFNNGPVCSICGMIFKSNEGEDHMCSHCLGQKRFFDIARSMGPYEGMLKMAIHGFKYRNQSTLASPLGELLSLYGGNTLNIKEYGLIIPVPLHFSRLRQRGFNQSLMLARKIGEMWNIKVSAEILIKLKHTTPQTMLSYKQRQKNVKKILSPGKR